MQQAPKDVRIINPVGDRRFTSRKRAERFVERGRAEWVKPGTTIRFVKGRPAVKKAMKLAGYWYDRAARSGMAEIANLIHVPMPRPSLLLNIGKNTGATRHTFLAARGL